MVDNQDVTAKSASEWDIVIIGGGPGGYVAAIRAAQMGARVCVVEKDELGGTCLNRGCIPTKALVASVSALDQIRQAAAFGVEAGEVRPDFAKMMVHKQETVDRLVKGVHYLFKKNKVTLIKGTARLAAPGRVEVEPVAGAAEAQGMAVAGGATTVLETKNVIIASGAEPAVFPAFGYDGQQVITSNEALALTEVPERLLIIGGGVIGCEFACIFAELGAKVTIVEAMPSILPMLDKEVSRQLQSYLKRRGITIKTKIKTEAIRKAPGEVTAVLEGGEEIVVDKVLVSVGRVVNTAGLGFAEAGVATTARGEVVVDDRMRTNVAGVYAIGDVTDSKYKLAHVASRQGIVAVENIMGKDSRMDYQAVPNAIFTLPEAASVGLTEDEAKERGLNVQSGKFAFIANGKALSMGETGGFVKMISDAATDRVLGVHIVGPHASDLIAEATLAVRLGATSAQVAETIHAHPTLAEVTMEAAEAVHGLAIHA